MQDWHKRLLIGAAIALSVLVLWQAGCFRDLTLFCTDLLFAARKSPASLKDVVIVGIDSASLKEFGPLPWRRDRYANAINKLNDAGAKVIGFDMWFTDQSRDPVEDSQLARASRNGRNVFFAMHVAEDGANIKATRTFAMLRSAIAGEGHVNVFPDKDGKLRRAAWETHSIAERYVFLPLLLAANSRGVPEQRISARDDVLRIGATNVPLHSDSTGRMSFLIDPAAENLDENYLSFKDVADGSFSAEKVRGKIVLVGQVILGGGYADIWDTPKGRKFGVVILAGIAQQLLDGRFIYEAPAAATVILIALIALSGPWLFRRHFSRNGWILHAGLAVAIWLGCFGLLRYANLLLDPVPLTAAAVLSLLVGVAAHLIYAKQQLIRDQKAMDILQSLGDAVVSSSGIPDLLSGAKSDIADSFVLPAKTPEVLMQTIRKAVGAREARLYLFRPEGDQCMAIMGADASPFSDSLPIALNRRIREKGEGFATENPERDLNLRERCPKSLLAMPITLGGRVMGAVQLFGKESADASPGKGFTTADLRLVAVMAQQATIGLENAALYDNMRGIFLHVTLALANAVDAKDPYTRGHSERVILYSDRLARAASLPLREVQVIRLAAALHDIGKIAIPDSILRKPGALTHEEYEAIKTHPARGAGIVGPLEELRSVIPGIRHHHERYDGKGYPDGLAGEAIPLCARIICIADSYDAITSKRYYRDGRSLEEGLAEIERCSGAQFDPALSAVFVQCMQEAKHPLPSAASETGVLA